MKPLISVIIPTHNRAIPLKRAIDSVLEQSFLNFELIVVDDASTDETRLILKEYESRGVKSFFLEKNLGVSAARNFGVAQSVGEWLAFLDSDDEWLTEKLEKQLEKAEDHPECPLIHGEEIWIRNGIRVNPMKKHQKKGGDVFTDSTRLCCISPSTALLKREFFEKMKGFKEEYPVCEDYELWLRITSQYEVGFVEEPLIKKYGGHSDQLSRRYFAMDFWRVKALSELLVDGGLNQEKQKIARSQIYKKSKILLKGYRKHENLEHYDFIFSLMKKAQAQLIDAQ